MANTLNFQEELIKRLRDLEYSAAYLNAAIAEGDGRIFLLALKDILEANGGIGAISKKT
jgi:DNA-binding phage protein